MVMALKDLTQKIIDVLKTDATLFSAVKSWAFGEPVKSELFPLIWVQLVGGPYRWKSAARMQQIIAYKIVIQNRDVDRDTAEKSVMDLYDLAAKTLVGNPDLDNNCRCIGIRNLQGNPSRRRDYAIAQISMSMTVEREYVP